MRYNGLKHYIRDIVIGRDLRGVVMSIVGVGILAVFNPAPLAAQLIPVSQEPTLPLDYPTVTLPLQCLTAVTRESQMIWRKGERDTIPSGSTTDTLPTEVVQRARQCAAQFSLTTLTSGGEVAGFTHRDIFPLIRLYLVAGWDDSVRTAVESLITKSTMQTRDTFMRRDILLLRVVDAYLNASPARLAEGQRYADALDALGAPAAVARLRVRTQLVDVLFTVADTAGITRNVQAALAAAAEIPARDRGLEFGRLRSVYYNAINAADVMKDSAMANTVMASVNELLVSLLAPNAETPDSLRRYLSPQMPIFLGMLQGVYESTMGQVRSLRPVSAEHWFAEDGQARPPVDSTLPTLVLKIDPHRCNGLNCKVVHAALQRLAKSYQPRGVQVVVLVSTAGYLHLNVFKNVADEVQAVRAYVQDTLKLPGILAISESEFVQRQDGKIQQIPRGNEGYQLGWFVIRDNNGLSHTKAFGFLSDRYESEAWVRRALDRMLEQ